MNSLISFVAQLHLRCIGAFNYLDFKLIKVETRGRFYNKIKIVRWRQWLAVANGKQHEHDFTSCNELHRNEYMKKAYPQPSVLQRFITIPFRLIVAGFIN